MTRAAERLFALVRATLRNRMDDASLFEGTDAAQWREIYDLSSVQGVLAQAWDGMQLLPEAMRPPRALRLQWAVNVERIEKVYRRQERAIARLAAFYREHAIPMMLLKGYGLSLFYPVPEHRPCGDIDIWLFGRQPEADKLVAREWGVPVDVHKEHHTTFDVDGIMVENHYDFVNKETHASNARLERLFKQYAAQPGESVAVAGVAVTCLRSSSTPCSCCAMPPCISRRSTSACGMFWTGASSSRTATTGSTGRLCTPWPGRPGWSGS